MKKYSIQNTTLVFLILRKINVLFVPGSKIVQRKNIFFQKEFETHMKEKELSRKEKEEDEQANRSEDSNYMVACFDLQAVIQLPKGEISAFYYK